MTSDSLPTHSDVAAAAQRLNGLVRKTPVLRHDALDAFAGARVFVKAECLQETGSFKIRGATNRLLQIPEDRPSDAPAVKVEGVEADGGEVHLYDRNTENREEIAGQIAAERGAVLVPSFEDPHIISGQGTAGLEFVAQMEEAGGKLDHLVTPAGGGGLASGLALALEGTSPDTGIWVAEPEGHDDWTRSLKSGRIERNAPGTRSICDAILTPAPGEMTFAIGHRLFSGGLVITDAQAKEAMRVAFRYLRIVAEPGGAAALAAALACLPEDMKGKAVGVVVSGGNVDAAEYAKILTGS